MQLQETQLLPRDCASGRGGGHVTTYNVENELSVVGRWACFNWLVLPG